MDIVKNDPFVKPANSDQIALIERVVKHHPVDDTVYLSETIHGHIAQFNYKEGRFIPFQKGTPARMDEESLKFWSDIAPSLRWFELGHGIITIGLKR